MAVTPGYYIMTDWVSKAQLYANGTLLKRMPAQDRPWIRQPGNEGDVIEHVKVLDTPSGQRFGLGALTFTWPLQGLSPQMVAYIQTTYFNTALSTNNFFQRAKHNKLTVQTFNRASNTWEVYHVHARLADFRNNAELSQGGFNNMKIDFTATGVAPDGPDLTLDATIDLAQVGVPFAVTFDIANEGDEATFNNTILIVEIPSGASYFDVNDLPSGGYIEYSTNDGLSYSGLEPGDLTTVSHVRITQTDPIDTGDVLQVAIILLATETATLEIEASVSSSGDIDVSNNSYTDSFDVNEFSPDIYSSLSLWLDAQTGVYSDNLTTAAINGAQVHTWYDRSSSAQNAVQTTLLQRPTYLTGQANGLAALQFDGSNDTMAVGIGLLMSSMNVTFFIVADPTNSASTPGPESYFAFTSNIVMYSHKVNDVNDTHTGVYYASGSQALALSSATNTLQQLTFASTQAGATLYRNTAEVGLAATTGVATSTLQGGGIGSDYIGFSQYYNGLIYEILIYDEVLTDMQRATVEQYLLEKYGL